LVRVEVSAAGVAVDGRRATSDEAALTAALLQADGAVIDVEAKSDAPAALVLAALTVDAGPHAARRRLTWQDVRLDVSEHHSGISTNLEGPVPASIFSWRSDRATQLWSVSAGSDVTNLGPFEPVDSAAEPGAISNLTKACAPHGCRFVVELNDERLLDVLRVWQRITAAVGPSLGLQLNRPWPPLPLPAGEREALGALPPELIQDVVRLGFGSVKACYESGLGRDPNLKGKVSVREPRMTGGSQPSCS
jgi:hypothetical protein